MPKYAKYFRVKCHAMCLQERRPSYGVGLWGPKILFFLEVKFHAFWVWINSSRAPSRAQVGSFLRCYNVFPVLAECVQNFLRAHVLFLINTPHPPVKFPMKLLHWVSQLQTKKFSVGTWKKHIPLMDENTPTFYLI